MGPPSRRIGGRALEAWAPEVPKKLTYPQHATAIAEGVLELLREARARGTAVLVASHDELLVAAADLAGTFAAVKGYGEGEPMSYSYTTERLTWLADAALTAPFCRAPVNM